ncbi:plasma membrane fusion protein prm1 [Knufia obscura]|uniref:Plasma membrane fusion protein PRM1 n=2 Tax=Knufia TaxID=430999 RepID=A0AAN8ELY7_9EURO|nr:plasma membrane fusion protein prm1 [Knufia obscura]KAK5958263.1 plasma membrane fusion protein prm1 [Knufia fluminis]
MAGHAPSMPAGSHEMRDFSSNQGPPRSSPHTAPSVTPYLGLRARLSQVWINRWTILLVLVLARTLIAIRDLDGNLSSARREALSACSSVEDMGSAMASMPHYMSQGVNELTASGIERAVNGLYAMTTMSVTGVEEIVVFVINLMTSTYLCLITLVVSGSLHAVLGVIEDANDKLKGIVDGLGDDIAKVLGGIDEALDKVRDSIGDVTSFFTDKPTIPDIDLTKQIDAVKNLKLPDGLDADLKKLNDSIPNFAQVQNFTDNAIRIPFELLKTAINDSLGVYTFDRSLFPVPQKEKISFCSDDGGINGFFDGLVKLIYDAKKIFLAVIIVAAVAVCILMAYREVRRWRLMQDRSRLVGFSAHDPLDVVYIVSRPHTSGWGISMSRKLKSVRRQSLIRWVVAYATTEAALFVLALGVAGLFTCLCQYILLKELEKQVPQLSNQVGDFADKVVLQLNNASESWALSTNDVITQKQNTINDDMFGWVNTSVDAINDTLNTFVKETTNVLNSTFGGTILYDPVKEVFNCLIGLKIVGIQKALTWVEDHAHVSFPLMPNDTFSLGAVASIAGEQSADQSFLATPGDAASDKITSAVVRVTNSLYDGIMTEAIISAFVTALWFVIVLIGLIHAMLLWFGRDKTRGEGGAPNLDAISPTNAHPSISLPIDFTSDNQDRYKSTNMHDVSLHDDRNVPAEPAPNYSREDPFGDDKRADLGYNTHQHPGRPLTERVSYYPESKT